MSISSWIKRVIGGFNKHHPEFETALEEWGKQFLTDLGQFAEQEAINYGGQVLSGKMTRQDALDAALADAKKQGIKKSQELVDVILNAIRTVAPE